MKAMHPHASPRLALILAAQLGMAASILAQTPEGTARVIDFTPGAPAPADAGGVAPQPPGDRPAAPKATAQPQPKSLIFDFKVPSSAPQVETPAPADAQPQTPEESISKQIQELQDTAKGLGTLKRPKSWWADKTDLTIRSPYWSVPDHAQPQAAMPKWDIQGKSPDLWGYGVSPPGHAATTPNMPQAALQETVQQLNIKVYLLNEQISAMARSMENMRKQTELVAQVLQQYHIRMAATEAALQTKKPVTTTPAEADK